MFVQVLVYATPSSLDLCCTTVLQTLVRMFLSIDFPIPDLKEFHKSYTVEEGGALVISLESWSMSSKILEKMYIIRGFCFMC